jgi:drug/metabolite transporter (DMT)-like permease
MVLGILFGLVSASLWATTSLAVKAQSARVDTLSFNAFRMVIGALFFLALLPFFGGWNAVTGLSSGSLTALSVSIICGAVIGDSLYFWSMTQIGASRAMPISGIYPLFTWALAVPILGETVTMRALLGTIFVLVGLTLIAPAVEVEEAHAARWNRLGVFAAIFAAAMWALSTTMMKIGLQDGVNIMRSIAFVFPGCDCAHAARVALA